MKKISLFLTLLFLMTLNITYAAFQDNGDGTVTDTDTGLMWQKTTGDEMDWESAIEYCENLTLAGYHDWRLPNIEELASLVDDSTYDPAINTIFLNSTYSWNYWSSTSEYEDSAWDIDFYDGYVDFNYKNSSDYVRAVRDEQVLIIDTSDPLDIFHIPWPSMGDAPLTSSVSISVTSGNPPYTYTWDFGDGNIIALPDVADTEKSEIHTYTEPGVYEGIVSVVDAEGQSEEKQFIITVTEPAPEPEPERPTSFEITATAEGSGTIAPAKQRVENGSTVYFMVDPQRGHLAEVSGCNGYLAGNIYTTGAITEPCTVTARFNEAVHTVTAVANVGGTIYPDNREVAHGETMVFMVTPDPGYNVMDISGCYGMLEDDIYYTTGSITAPCTVTARFGLEEQLGSLEVSISPDEAIQAGGRWRLTDATDWNDNGTAISGIPVGDHTIEFKEIDGWSSPTRQSVTIKPGETTRISTAEYQPGRTSHRAAILVHPRGSDPNDDMNAIQYMILYAWKALEERRLTDDEIYLLSYTPFMSKTGAPNPDDIVDAPVTLNDWAQEGTASRDITVNDFEAAFDWAASLGKLEEPLLFIFTGHGMADQGLRLDPMNGLLTGETLATLLDHYQEATGNAVTVVIEACYSGTLIPVLAGPNRIVITSTKDTQAGYIQNGMGTYSRLFFSELRVGKTFFDAFQQAKEDLPNIDQSQNSVFKEQKPQLDDNGDGLYTESDGVLAKQYKINTYGALDLPITLTPQTVTGSVAPGSSLPLRVAVSLGAESVWALIVTPETVQNMDINGYPLIPAPTVDLTQEEDTGIWRGEFSDFSYTGDYTVSFYARDKKGFVNSSSPVVLTITGAKDAMALPVPSRSVYKAGDQIRVRVPHAPEGFSTYAAMTIPGRSELIMLTKKSTPILFDGSSFPAFTDSDGLLLDLSIVSGWPVMGSALTAPGPAWPVGHYGVYLLQSPTGKDPLDPQVIASEWRLGYAAFEVQ